MDIKKVGVVGFGTMGQGIIQVCAQAGFQVVASEINEQFLNKGYQVLPYTRGHNSEPVYPITYYKRGGVE